ncbi:MAG: hypothetical protein WAZ18_03810 [Alphaproteobacteria bacterium]
MPRTLKYFASFGNSSLEVRLKKPILVHMRIHHSQSEFIYNAIEALKAQGLTPMQAAQTLLTKPEARHYKDTNSLLALHRTHKQRKFPQLLIKKPKPANYKSHQPRKTVELILSTMRDLQSQYQPTSVAQAARHLTQTDNNFKYISPSTIKGVIYSHATPNQRDDIHTLTLNKRRGARDFTESLAQDCLITGNTDAFHIFSTFQPPHFQMSLNFFKSHIHVSTTKNSIQFPPHLSSNSLTTATSALRLLKARAEHVHPTDQPGNVLAMALPEYMVRPLLQRCLEEARLRTLQISNTPNLPSSPQTASPDR